MLEDQQLRRVLESLPLTVREGPFHRYVLHRYVALAVERRTPLHILSGEWSRTTGGRFNYPQLYRVAYLATDARTAQVEAERIQAPYVHVPISGRLQGVLDLTQPDVLRALETSDEELSGDWRVLNARGIEAPSQRLGYAARVSERVEAVLYRSTVWPAGTCLAVFPERLAPGSSLEVVDPDEILHERIP
jgi:RES domain-containing protein